MNRFYGFLMRTQDIKQLALTPRIRLTTGSPLGIGVAWLTAWAHVWLWKTNGRGRQIELLPYVWIHWHPQHGSGVHIWFIRWHWHAWFRRGPSTVNGDA